MRITFIFLIFATPLLCAAQSTYQSFCAPRAITLNSSPNPLPLSFDQATFSSNDSYSYSSVRVSNKGDQDIERLFVVIDYLNDRSDRLISVEHFYQPVAVLPSDMGNNFKAYKKFARLVNREALPNIGNGEDGPLMKNGGRKLLSGSSSLVVTKCPSSASVVAIAMEYYDGEVKTFFAPGWHLEFEPASEVISYGWLKDVSVPNGLSGLLASTHGFLKLEVAANGCATLSGGEQPQNWMVSSAPHWLVFPAQTNGSTVGTSLPLGVVVHTSTGIIRSWDSKMQMPAVMAVAHIRADSDSQQGVLMLGSFPMQQVEFCGASSRESVY